MSIIVSKLSKLYGEQKAVDSISFEVKQGDVLGFLGPNGAGKSTTMKIIAGYIPQSSGKASVCGFDVNKQSFEARKMVGYLPENNPLYLDLYVKEFLGFIAGIHKLKNKTARIKEMIDMTGLTTEQHKKIGALSKGYRQRVGLAQAIIHDPKVLIMDEPTTGLDPNQLAEIRELIKNLGKEKTVILSTHIMQEVLAVCNRVVIINNGKIVADDVPEKLIQNTSGEKILFVQFKEKVEEQKLKLISSVKKVIAERSNSFRISGTEKLQEEIFHFAVENKLTILSMNEEKQSLEEAFRILTN